MTVFLRKLPGIVGPDEKIRTSRQRAQERLLAVPARDVGVMTADQDIRHAFSAKVSRACVLRPFKETGRTDREAVALGACFMAQHAGQQTSCRINYRQGSEFTPAENIVTDTEFIRDQLGANPLVDAFVASANKRQTGM